MNLYDEALKEVLEKEGISVWLDRGQDVWLFIDGFRAGVGVEWAEEYGDCSMVKFFIDNMKKKKKVMNYLLNDES